MNARRRTALSVSRRGAGFTLIELLLASMLSALVITAVLQVFSVSLYAREEVKALAEPMTAGPRILDMIEEDLRALWTFDIKENKVFEGEDAAIVRIEADRLHLIVAGPTASDVTLPDDSQRRAPLAEVSYLCKTNPRNPDLIELWRREDPLVDEDWKKGGHYQLLSDRIRRFNITYYEELGVEAEPFDDWILEEKKDLPRRLKIELSIERRPESFNVLDGSEVEDIPGRKLDFVRHVVLRREVIESIQPGYAVLPAIPQREPEPENAQVGGGAGPLAGGGRTGLPGAPGRPGAPGPDRGIPGGAGGTGGDGKGFSGAKTALPPGLGGQLGRFLKGGGGGSSGNPFRGKGGGGSGGGGNKGSNSRGRRR